MTELSKTIATRATRIVRDEADAQQRLADLRVDVIISARECMARATSAGVPADLPPNRLRACDETFRQLYNCVREYARRLRSAGENADAIGALLTSSIQQVLAPEGAHPAVIAAIIAWSAEDGNG